MGPDCQVSLTRHHCTSTDLTWLTRHNLTTYPIHSARGDEQDEAAHLPSRRRAYTHLNGHLVVPLSLLPLPPPTLGRARRPHVNFHQGRHFDKWSPEQSTPLSRFHGTHLPPSTPLLAYATVAAEPSCRLHLPLSATVYTFA